MKILLVSATKYEIAPFIKTCKKISSVGNFTSYQSAIHSVDVLITGVGMTATAFGLGKILHKKYDLAINAGVAGSFKKDIALGTVVNVVSDCFADFGVEDGNTFITAAEIGLVSSSEFKVSGLFNKNKLLKSLPKVEGITVNTVHGNTTSIKKVVQKFNPEIESMEGAAFYYSCQQSGLPALQIRAISNYVEKRNKKKWKMENAISNLNFFLEEFLQQIIN